jgi:hypothetical protein
MVATEVVVFWILYCVVEWFYSNGSEKSSAFIFKVVHLRNSAQAKLNTVAESLP